MPILWIEQANNGVSDGLTIKQMDLTGNIWGFSNLALNRSSIDRFTGKTKKQHWRFSHDLFLEGILKWGIPQWMVYFREIPLKWIIWGYHYFRKPPFSVSFDSTNICGQTSNRDGQATNNVEQHNMRFWMTEWTGMGRWLGEKKSRGTTCYIKGANTQ